MSVIGNYSPFDLSQHPEIPPWIADVMKNSDKQLKILTEALQGGAALMNLNVELMELKLLHGNKYTCALNTLRGMPKGAWLIFSGLPNQPYPKLTFDIQDEKRVGIMVTFDSDPHREIDIRILVMGS